MKQAERIGRFEVQERIRGNSFALVYRGRDPFDGRRVQIKFCVASDETTRRRFLLAAEGAVGLRHPNIATVFEFGSGDSKPYLVQEAFSEESLADLLASGEPVDDVLKLYYMVQIARGLQHAHSRGILHRELRPASVLVQKNSEAKLTDFGIARLASASARFDNGRHRWPAVGWLLPELLLGLELDVRSDIYGFGALSYELLTGEAPFAADSLAALVPQVLESEPRPLGDFWMECPAELDRLVLRCLSRDPSKRFASMNEVLDDLDQIVPVMTSDDVEEEEKTLVTEEVQTVYVAETAERDLEEPIEATDQPAPDDGPVPVEEPPPVIWHGAAASARPRDWGASALVIDLARRITDGVRALLSIRPARPQAVLMALLALLLLTAVGWSVLRAPPRTSDAIPQNPVRTVADLRPKTGRLIVDAQPWAEVLRVTGEDGRDLPLPPDRFTPLPIEVPAGRYEVRLSRPDRDEVHSCWVEVGVGANASCEPEVAALGLDDFFKQTGWWQ